MSRLLQRVRDVQLPPAIVAEMSGNHNQDLDTARHIVSLAKGSGAHAIKLQTYTPDSLTLPSSRPEFVARGGSWEGRRLHELYQQACTPYEWHKPLARHARKIGIEIFSTPFDEEAVDFLESAIRPSLYKISSFELTHLPLLARVAETGKPVILSVGMATAEEIDEAAQTLRDHGCPETILLKCISAYPAQPESFNLRSMLTLKARYRSHVGLSDHTLGPAVAIAATALGARLIEKHFTDARSHGGIDATFSIEPAELRELVASTEAAFHSLGNDRIGPSPQESSQAQFRRSIYVASDIAEGEALTGENLRIVRPALGLAPKRWSGVLGRRARRDLKAGEPLREEDIR